MKRVWYVLHVKPRTEKKTEERLKLYRLWHHLPVYRKITREQRRKVVRELPLFPGYVFACMNADERLRMLQTNLEQTPGYGEDKFCESARKKIRAACECPNADVFFLVGGTQTNMTVIAAALRPYEGVLCADTGHINVHETGAVEATGHKVLGMPSVEGKISAEQVKKAIALD